jgi:hypothetical protein
MKSDTAPGNSPGPEIIADSTSRSVVGRILYERFLILSERGDPNFGRRSSTYLAKDLKAMCRTVVLRSVNIVSANPPGSEPTFQEVGDVLLQIAHPNTETVLETGVLFDGRPYALTEPLTGTPLDQFVKEGQRLELENAAVVIEQVADALDAAHSRRLLHCDVRPSNIVVDAVDGRIEQVRLINFGCAWPIDCRGDSLSHLRPGAEPLLYAAPELLSRLGHRSTASDIYSLSAIAYRLVLGSPPFPGGTREEILAASSRGPEILPTDARTDISNETEQLILSGLRFEPAWRPQDAADFGYRLARSLREGPRSAPVRTLPIVEEADLGVVDEIAEVKAVEQPEGAPAVSAPAPPSRPARPASDRAIAWSLIFLLLAGALSIPVGQSIFEKQASGAAIETIQKRPAQMARNELRFWRASASPLRNGAGAAGFELTVDTQGEVYVFCETSTPEGSVGYRLLRPARQAEFNVDPSEVVSIGTGCAAGEPTWLAWTSEPVEGLAKAAASVQADGSVAPENSRELRHFLERNRNMRLSVTDDAVTGKTLLSGIGGKMVYRIDPPDADVASK